MPEGGWGGEGRKMWLVDVQERKTGREPQTLSVYLCLWVGMSIWYIGATVGRYNVLDLSVYRPVNPDQSSQFTVYETHGKWSWDSNTKHTWINKDQLPVFPAHPPHCFKWYLSFFILLPLLFSIQLLLQKGVNNNKIKNLMSVKHLFYGPWKF